MKGYIKMKYAIGVILVLAVTVYFNRNRVTCYLQVTNIHSLRSKVSLENNTLIPKDNRFAHHAIYQLRGIERIWPHRVNSLQRLRYLYNDFPGFECDISYDPHSQRFLLGHDDTTPDSLSLADYLAFDKDKKMFWLDVKALELNSIDQFCASLDALDKQYHIKDRVIVESTEATPLVHIADKGYFTSWYIPYFDEKQIQLSNDSLTKMIAIANDHFEVISDDYNILSWTNRYFTKKKLTWDLSFSHSFKRNVLLQHANDTTALIYLVNIKSPGYR